MMHQMICTWGTNTFNIANYFYSKHGTTGDGILTDLLLMEVIQKEALAVEQNGIVR